jgi:hypothetical protein
MDNGKWGGAGRQRSKDGEKEQNSFLSSLFDFFAFAVFPLR